MYSLVAMLNCVTALPLDRLRISGSRVRRPVNRTLFTVRSPSRSADGKSGRPCVVRRDRHGGQRRAMATAARPGGLAALELLPAPAVGPPAGALTIGGRRTV